MIQFSRYIYCAIAFILLFTSCYKTSLSKTINIEDAYFKGSIHIEKNKKLGRFCLSIHNLKTGGKDRIFTPYEVFSMQTGDINGDGHSDICLGIIKPTPFDSILKKRFFVFQIDNDYIRPLWLSSRLVKPLEDFRIISQQEDTCVLLTIEKESKYRFCVSEYRWGSFGMHWIKTHESSLSLRDAQNILSQNKYKSLHYD